MYRITVEEKLPGGAWKEVKKCEAPGLLCMAMTPEKDRAINMFLGLSARDIARMLIYCDETRAVMKFCTPVIPLADMLAAEKKEDIPPAIDAEAMLTKLDQNPGACRELKGPLIAGILDAMKRRKA